MPSGLGIVLFCDHDELRISGPIRGLGWDEHIWSVLVLDSLSKRWGDIGCAQGAYKPSKLFISSFIQTKLHGPY